MGQAGPPTPQSFDVDEKLKQYEFYANTAEMVIDRRNGVNRFFITIHTGLLTLITLVAGYGLFATANASSATGTNTPTAGGSTSPKGPTPPLTAFLVSYQGGIAVFLCLLGAVLCTVWWVNISQYRKLNTAKYDVIHMMEHGLPFQAFAEEWRILMGGARTSGPPIKRYRQVTRVEQALPMIACVVYLVVGGTFGFVSGLFQALLTFVTHLF